MSSQAAPAKAAAPVVAPVNATMGNYAPAEHIAAVSTPTVHTHTAAAVAAARALGREGQAAEAAPAAPIGDAPTEPAAPVAPEKPAEPAKEDSPTARIAQLTRARREAEARERVASQRAEAAATEAAAAKKEAAALTTIREAFKKDPLQAFKELGENWADIVDRVANGGLPPTPEQVAAAEKERAQTELAERLKRLESERDAEKTEAQTAADAAATKNARVYIAEKILSPEKHPRLVAFAEDASGEALEQVNLAMAEAFKKGLRSSPHPVDMDETVRLTTLALDGLNAFYDDLANKLSPPAAKQPVAPVATQAATTPVATSKQRGPDTITNAVAGVSPPAAQPRNMTPDEARLEVMRLARSLPPL